MKCPYCGSENTIKYYEAKMPNILSACPEHMLSRVDTFPFTAELCKDCLLGFNASRLDEEQLKLIYDNYIYISPLQGIGATKYEGMLETLKKYYSSEDRLVDIGCSEGYLLKKLKDAGYANLTGIEPGPQAEQARELGLNVIKAYFDGSTFESELFDGLFLMHVFEHLDRPFDMLEQMKKNLAPGGKIVIEVPYFGGYHHQHLFFYNHSFLHRLCLDKGLKIVEKIIALGAIRVVITHKDHPGYAEVENTESRDEMINHALSLYEGLKTRIEKMNALLRDCTGKKVYWWGAGSAAAIYINQLDRSTLDALDVTVVDSDKSKHGFYIAGHNLKVNPVEAIQGTEADLIIVASSFYNEIKARIEENGIRARNIEVLA